MALSYPTELFADSEMAIAAVQQLSDGPGDRLTAKAVPLVLLIGLPGSGKSTWARLFAQHAVGWQVVSTDQIRAQCYGSEAIQGDWLTIWRQVLQKFARSLHQMQLGQCRGVLYDATNVRRRDRRQFLQQVRAQGFTPIIGVWFDVPLAVCLHRNQRRSRQVPGRVILRMHRQLKGAPPSLREAMDHLIRIVPEPLDAQK